MTWTRLKAALDEATPDIGYSLAPGASETDLDSLEETVGAKLPSEFRQTWGEHAGMSTSPFMMLEFLSPGAMTSEWLGLRDYDGSSGGLEAEPSGPVKAMWDNPAWIPFILIGGSTWHFCLDLDPAEGGTMRQVIHTTPKDSERVVVASGIDAFLQKIATALHEGRFEIEDDAIDICDVLGI